MSTNSTATAQRRSQVMVGELPGDFLRISSTPQQQQAYADERVARVLQAQQNFMPIPANIKGRLNISIVQGMREVDLQRIADREEENKTLMDDVAANRKLVTELEASLELARNAAEEEKDKREKIEQENKKLRSERQSYDSTIKDFKVKLGISTATKNVNVRQTELLKKKDEVYKFTLEDLENRLRLANAEIERLKTRAMETGQTADSLQSHNARLKKYRKRYDGGFILPSPFEFKNSTGWSPNRMTPSGSRGPGSRGEASDGLVSRGGVMSRGVTSSRDRVSMGSTGSVSDRTPILPKINSTTKSKSRQSAP